MQFYWNSWFQYEVAIFHNEMSLPIYVALLSYAHNGHYGLILTIDIVDTIMKLCDHDVAQI